MEYRGHGFWARDGVLELWLSLLATEALKVANASAWLRATAAEWSQQAAAGLIGCVEPNLDARLPTPERVDVIVDIAQRVLAGLRQRGPVLPKDWLNSLGLGGPGARFTVDLPTDEVTSVAEAFIRLLHGELPWTASDSPILPA